MRGEVDRLIQANGRGLSREALIRPVTLVLMKATDAGTGPKGRIYRLSPQGKATVFYTTKQEHVLCVASGPDGATYAGTDKGGLVYRIDARGKGFVLYQAPQPEGVPIRGRIRALKSWITAHGGPSCS